MRQFFIGKNMELGNIVQDPTPKLWAIGMSRSKLIFVQETKELLVFYGIFVHSYYWWLMCPVPSRINI